jgi:hypothetical protein
LIQNDENNFTLEIDDELENQSLRAALHPMKIPYCGKCKFLSVTGQDLSKLCSFVTQDKTYYGQ